MVDKKKKKGKVKGKTKGKGKDKGKGGKKKRKVSSIKTSDKNETESAAPSNLSLMPSISKISRGSKDDLTENRSVSALKLYQPKTKHKKHKKTVKIPEEEKDLTRLLTTRPNFKDYSIKELKNPKYPIISHHGAAVDKNNKPLVLHNKKNLEVNDKYAEYDEGDATFVPPATLAIVKLREMGKSDFENIDFSNPLPQGISRGWDSTRPQSNFKNFTKYYKEPLQGQLPLEEYFPDWTHDYRIIDKTNMNKANIYKLVHINSEIKRNFFLICFISTTSWYLTTKEIFRRFLN
ncbi:hypothetical protein SNEBB_001820 [Seison nebaliae]|nr:hypothetical protein SNEBB_001820 [Seison nebaliae]